MNSLKIAAVALGVMFFNNVKAQNLSQGLVACYPFSGNANDMSGNNLNGVVNGATLTADRFGNLNSAYGFNGVSDYISLGNLFNFFPSGNTLTISVWEQANILKTQTLIMADPDSFNDRFNFMAYYDHNGVPYMFEDFGNCNTTGRLGLQMLSFSNAWEHYVYIVDSVQNYMSVYVNGSLMTFKNTCSVLNDRNRQLNIGYGKDVNNTLFYFNGKIDDIRIYNRVLTIQEIQMLYAQNPICSPSAIRTETELNSIKLRTEGKNKFLLDVKNQYGRLKFIVFNSTGSRVMFNDLKAGSNEFNFSNFPGGLYELQIYNATQVKNYRFTIE